MNITRENYEAYIIDYLDGRLDPIQSTELMHFLSQNPDLREEFYEFENIEINKSAPIELNKEPLKKDFSDIKQINEDNFDEFCVAMFEGDLNDHDESRLKKYIKKHSEKKKDLDLYSKIHLLPDYSIKYSEKDGLKKSSPFIRRKNLLLYATSIAAAILFLVLLVGRQEKEKDVISEIHITENIPDEKISSQKEYKNNVADKEKPVAKAEKSKPSYYTGNKQISEKIHDNLLADNTDNRREMPEYLTPIYPRLTNTIEYTDLMLSSDIIASKRIYENKHAQVTSAGKKEENTDNYGIYGYLSNKINVWTIAEAGVKSFNYLTESEVRLSKQTGNEGEIVAFALNSETFSISSPLKK